ncbi:hypothetical protein WJX73_002440 [Symbiochloris irregularis]|uniref:Uncharacterized protein n=1 Tax=Symbiochloris irregularis TaxID=706552 RepID=A0AAW1NWC8_9CHLO
MATAVKQFFSVFVLLCVVATQLVPALLTQGTPEQPFRGPSHSYRRLLQEDPAPRSSAGPLLVQGLPAFTGSLPNSAAAERATEAINSASVLQSSLSEGPWPRNAGSSSLTGAWTSVREAISRALSYVYAYQEHILEDC